MTIQDRLRQRKRLAEMASITTAATRAYRRRRDEGVTHAQARKEVEAEFKGRYGNRADWNAILDLILAVIEALRKVLVR